MAAVRNPAPVRRFLHTGKIDTQPKGVSQMTNKQIGEGSYEGARQYKEETEEFLGRKGKDVGKLAKEAEAAIDGPEGEALAQAEAEGKRHARD
jgi:hypothetical protein